MLFTMTVIALSILVPTMLIILSIMLIIYYVDGYITNLPKIKFTQFQKFYSVNPNRWDLRDDYVACWTDKQQHYVGLRFGFIDYYRYKSWHRSIIKNKFKQESNKQMAEIITAVKQDIAASEAKAKQMQEEFLNNLKHTYVNIPEDNLMELINEYKELYEQCQKR